MILVSSHFRGLAPLQMTVATKWEYIFVYVSGRVCPIGFFVHQFLVLKSIKPDSFLLLPKMPFKFKVKDFYLI